MASVALGSFYTCAVTTPTAALVCWGYWGGDGAGDVVAVPADLGPVAQVAAGYEHMCALTPARAVRCWGPASAAAAVPPGLSPAVSVVAGRYHTCALTTARAVNCWGKNDYGQASVPADLGRISALTAGLYHTCALTTAGAVRCWWVPIRDMHTQQDRACKHAPTRMG